MISNDTSSLAPPGSGTYDWDNFKPGAGGFPGLGGTYTDPVFGAVNPEGSVVRVLTARGAATGWSEIYSKNWGNADGTYFMDDFAQDDPLTIRSTTTGAIGGSGTWTGQPQSAQGAQAWHPTDPDKYFYVSGSNIQRRNLTAQTSTQMRGTNFPAALEGLGASHNWFDRTGRYFIAQYSGTAKVWDSQEGGADGTIYTGTITPGGGGGYIMMSPDGNWVIDIGGSTPRAFPLNHTTNTIGSAVPFISGALAGVVGDHMGILSASNGKTYAVAFEQDSGGSPASTQSVYAFDVSIDQTGQTTAQQLASATLLFHTATHEGSWFTAGHMTTVGRGDLQDWCFLDTECGDSSDPSTAFHAAPSDVSGWYAYKMEIIALNVITQEVRRLAHTRMRGNIGSSYYRQSRMSCAWDGSFVYWQSNFNVSTPDEVNNFYGINNPLGAVAAGGSQTMGNRGGRRRGLTGLLR